MKKSNPPKRFTPIILIAAMGLGATLLLGVAAVSFYPNLKSGYNVLKGTVTQNFVDVTDGAGIRRHHAGPHWLGTFSASVVDFDNDGHDDLFVNNHERNRPYFYRNLGDGTFVEMHEAIGLWENPIGPVFGKPEVDSREASFALWLEPKQAIDGTWRLRWSGNGSAGASGEITTNTWFESVDKIGLEAHDKVDVQRGMIRFDAQAGAGERGLDFRSHFPESTLRLTLRFDGEEDSRRVFIGPRGVHPQAMPFELSLGDRHACAWGDYDNDGHADLFVTRGAMVGFLRPPFGVKHEELFRNVGESGFRNVIVSTNIRNDYGRGRAAQWVDFDNDGHLDLYVSNLGTPNLLFQNRGDGTFEEVGETNGVGLIGQAHFVWADFDGDGRADVFFNHPARLFINQGDGTVREVSEAWRLDAPSAPISKNTLFWGAGPSVADFDRDGDLDVFLAGGKLGPASLLLENRGGYFVDITRQAGMAGLIDVMEGIWGDFDNDGHIDLYTIGTTPDANKLLKNSVDKTFTDVTDRYNLDLANRPEWSLNPHAGGVATWLDYNNDGFLDLFLATRRIEELPDQEGGTVKPEPSLLDALMERSQPHMKGKIPGTHFLLKNTGSGNHWVKVKLAGRKSNRSGFGAKVYLTTGDGIQYQEMGAGGKMRYAQNDVPLHFGMGRAETVDNIKVIWPSGVEQIVKYIKADTVVRIEEPVQQAK